MKLYSSKTKGFYAINLLEEYKAAGSLPDDVREVTDEEEAALRYVAPLPVDLNDAINTKIATIESSTMVPRVVRESLMRAEERAAAQDATATNTAAMILKANLDYQRVKAVDDQIKALRAQLK
jgi:hypothetical protein